MAPVLRSGRLSESFMGEGLGGWEGSDCRIVDQNTKVCDTRPPDPPRIGARWPCSPCIRLPGGARVTKCFGRRGFVPSRELWPTRNVSICPVTMPIRRHEISPSGGDE